MVPRGIRIVKEQLNILAYADVSDDSEGEFLDSDSDSDSDVPTASSHKQFQPRTLVLTSDSDTNTGEEENSESESSDVWCETDKKPSSCPFLGTSGVNSN